MANTLKHTKGSWKKVRIAPTNGEKVKWAIVIKSNNITVVDSISRQADANLIAEAPDMLNALISCEKHFADLEDRFGLELSQKILRDLVRAIIKQATK